jgi:undecaprenyl-diphosphatase
MNEFDLSILQFFNQFVGRCPLFDDFVRVLAENSLLKGGVVMIAFWWAWFRWPEDVDPERRARPKILVTFASAMLAVVIARGLAHLLPYRSRPLELELGLQAPAMLNKTHVEGWSSFPSDHGMLFFALATGMLCVSRPLGLLVLLHTVVLICLPRVYLLIHNPTDLMAAAVLGSAFGLFANWPPIRDRLAEPMLRLAKSQPAWFYAFAFFITYQAALLFDPVRYLGKFVLVALDLYHPPA